MFYKDDYNLPGKELIKNNPLEFSLVLKEKFKDYPEYKCGYLTGLDFEGGAKYLEPIVFKDRSFFCEHGEITNLKNYYSKKYPDFKNFTCVESVLPTTCNEQVLEKIKDNLKDFFVPQLESSVQDKGGKEYTIKIIKNSDTTIGDRLIVDQLFLYDGEERVGHISVKYTTKSILEKLCADNYNRKDFFIDRATIDYSKLNEDYRGKGLGYVMYFHIAQYLERQGVDFRASTLQSNSAQRLWQGIHKNWGEYITSKKLNDTSYAFLKMTQDLTLSFKEGKPQIISKKLNPKL